MWKRESGDWEQRRNRRPVSDSPHVQLPESKAASHGSHGFVRRSFKDEQPTSVCPAAVEKQEAVPVANTSPELDKLWVILSGVEEDSRLDVREYLHSHYGRVLAMVEPPGIPSGVILRSGGTGRNVSHHVNMCCVRFENPIVAAQVVYTGMHYVTVDQGSACYTRQQYIASRAEKIDKNGDKSKHNTNSNSQAYTAGGSEGCILEFTASWMTDPAMLAMLCPAAASTADTKGRSSLAGGVPLCTPSQTTTTGTMSTGREGTRHTSEPSSTPTSSSQEYSGRDASPSQTAATETQGSTNTSVLALFISSTVCGNVWLSLLRVVVMLAWTVVNALLSLVYRQPQQLGHSSGGSVSGADEVHRVLLNSSVSRRRTRRRAAQGGDGPAWDAGLMPIDRGLQYFSAAVPFAPRLMQVDTLLWSWLWMRSPYTEQNLRQLRLSLDRQITTSGQSSFPRKHFFGQSDASPSNVLSATPAVLLSWRPSWWFTRYVVLSSLLLLWVLWRCIPSAPLPDVGEL